MGIKECVLELGCAVDLARADAPMAIMNRLCD